MLPSADLRGKTPGSSQRIGMIIPCFRVRTRILAVLERIGPEVDAIYVVDDCCPEGTGSFVEQQASDPRIRVLVHEANQGVGGAVLTGIEAALQDGMNIVVKVDGDGQMDPALLPLFIRPILEGEADVAKGNRFYNPDDVRAMPGARLFGNACLSFLTKLSSGYWNSFDPTNGYVAWDCRLLAMVPRDKVEKRYLFETDMLFRVGLLRAKVTDIPMTAVYGEERSNMIIRKQILPFLVLNLRNFAKRLFYNYFLRDFNVASLEIMLGLGLILFSTIYGLSHWGGNAPASAGIVMIAALPLLTGIILLTSFVNFDIQQVPRETVSPRLPPRRQSGSEPANTPTHVVKAASEGVVHEMRPGRKDFTGVR
jgi:dolichol-phosphate mannosyltransferase